MSTTAAEITQESANRTPNAGWLGGFLLLGVLLGQLGSLVIGWGYHIDGEPGTIGLHFLSMNAGYVAGAALAKRYLKRVSLRALALASSSVGCLSLISLAVLAPPILVGWRIFCLGISGLAAGGLATALLYASESFFTQEPAVAVNRAGLLVGGGSLLATLMMRVTYSSGSAQLDLVFLTLVPLCFFFVYLRSRDVMLLRPLREPQEDVSRETLKDLRSIATLLFSLLLFFQFGNEWAIAGWLPLFLTHRLGSSPESAVMALALYFLALTIGRVVAQVILSLINHRKLLLGSIALAMFGYLLLSLTSSMVGALLAVIIIGAGFAPIYPLIAESLDERFSYHPGFYHGTVSVAITGAMSTPWLLGYIDAYFGIRFVMLVPAFGSIMVLVLAFLIMLEARLMGGTKQGHGHDLLIGAGHR